MMSGGVSEELIEKIKEEVRKVVKEELEKFERRLLNEIIYLPFGEEEEYY